MLTVILDTNVIVSALRSPTGASAELLEKALDGYITIAASTPLVFEYEASCKYPEQRLASGLSEDEVDIVVDAICAVAIPIEIDFLWRPQLRDAADEMVLEVAANSAATMIVTYNLKDYGDAPRRFGLEVIRPGDLLKRMRS